VAAISAFVKASRILWHFRYPPTSVFGYFGCRFDDKRSRGNDLKGIITDDPFWIKWNLGMLTIGQLRAARGLIGWSQSELAEHSGLSLPTVKRVEAGTGPRVSDLARNKLQRALEAAGVEFIEENGGGAGVRLRKRRQRSS
jgi:hypothetical protein